mmetsp:Transcript_9789/g.17292  ORF Transcript_9789/g.17292 Transcript_9789/m.17292 type:complete len:86 (-) Transcript_9789:1007-1264(-)
MTTDFTVCIPSPRSILEWSTREPHGVAAAKDINSYTLTGSRTEGETEEKIHAELKIRNTSLTTGPSDVMCVPTGSQVHGSGQAGV